MGFIGAHELSKTVSSEEFSLGEFSYTTPAPLPQLLINNNQPGDSFNLLLFRLWVSVIIFCLIAGKTHGKMCYLGSEHLPVFVYC